MTSAIFVANIVILGTRIQSVFLYQRIDIGEDVFDLRIDGYEKNISFLDLVLGYTYIMGEYFNVFDTFAYRSVDIDDQMRSDIDTVRSISGYGISNNDLIEAHPSLSKKYTFGFLSNIYNINAFDNIDDSDNISVSSDYNDELYDEANDSNGVVNLTVNNGESIETVASSDDSIFESSKLVFGWNGDINDKTPLDIMKEIDSSMRRLCVRPLWYPQNTNITSDITKAQNTILYRKLL